MKKLVLSLAIAASTLLPPSSSRADESVPCADAATEGQRLKNDHKLVEARQQFQACARRQCPAIVQTDCLKWLEEADRSLPTVVVTAKDGAGVDLIDVKVAVDGKALASKLDGQAVPVNPGRHIFQFSLPDGTELDEGAIIREGVKDQSVSVVLGRPMKATAAAPAAAVPAVSASGHSPWNTVGWILGGSGALGLGVGTVFGILAIHDNSSANCNANKQGCLPGPLADARTAAVGADIGLIAGGALLAGGLTLVLVTPRRRAEASGVGVNVTPLAGPGGAGLTFGGTF